MIDWDMDEIIKIEKHYNQVLNPRINFTYFCRHFEEIYRLITNDEEILPDILNDITYYTLNGVNAKYKLLFNLDDDKELTEILTTKITEQKNKRQQAREKGLKDYYEFILRELEEFVQKYPYWKELLKYEK